MEIVADKMWVQTQVTLIVERSCRSVSVHVKFHIFYNIYIYICHSIAAKSTGNILSSDIEVGKNLEFGPSVLWEKNGQAQAGKMGPYCQSQQRICFTFLPCGTH